MIIVEGSIGKVLKGLRHSKISGITVIKTLFSFWVRYDVPVVFAKDREEAARFIIEYYAATWRKRRDKR